MSRFFVLVTILATLFFPFVASGAEINRSWDTLAGTVKTGKKVTVMLMNSSSVEGKLLAIDSHSITVQQLAGPQTIEAAEVFRVRYAGIRKRHAVYGTLIGAPCGAVALWGIDRSSSHPRAVEAAVLGALFFGLPGGAIAGAAVPIGPPLYEAAKVVRKTP
jgi:hypothetical protein